MAAQIQSALTILRRKQVEARTGLSRSSIYARLRQNPKRPGDYDRKRLATTVVQSER
jgi:Prophage CP4-57 regulatory protein (AlpA).